MLFHRLVQRAGTSAPGRALGQLAYRAIAPGAAEWLLSIPGVLGVHSTGSLYGAWLQPGYSDVDLVLVVELRDVEHELRLREGLRRRLRTLNALGLLIRDVDYLEAKDLPLLRRFPDGWALDLDRRWVRLAGLPLEPPARDTVWPSAEMRALTRTADVLRRWLKASAFLLDPTARRDPFVESRGAKRLLADCLAARLDVDRQTPLRALLDQAEASGITVTEQDRRGERLTVLPRAGVEHLVSRALDVLEPLARAVGDGWHDGWPSPPAAEPVVADDAACALGRTALDVGFRSALVAPRGGGQQMVLVLADEAPASAQVARHVRLLARGHTLPPQRYTWAPRPILITPALLGVAALFEPPPLIGSHLAAGHFIAWGAPPPVPARPPEPLWAELIGARAVRQFRRARNRAFRKGKPLDALAREVHAVARSLDQLVGEEPLTRGSAGGGSGERELLELHWRWIARWRERLRGGRASDRLGEPGGRVP